jgi:hypothetical protein
LSSYVKSSLHECELPEPLRCISNHHWTPEKCLKNLRRTLQPVEPKLAVAEANSSLVALLLCVLTLYNGAQEYQMSMTFSQE